MVGVITMVGKVDNNESVLKNYQAIIESNAYTSKEIENINQNKSESEEAIEVQKEVVLFFSYDIVNSTLYKTINYFGWSKVINSLFQMLQKEVKNQINGAELWRVLGDEAIFIVKIKELDTVYSTIDSIYSILIQTIHKLRNGEFFDSKQSKKEMKLEKLQNILSLKATAWIAAVARDSDNLFETDELIENVFVTFQPSQPTNHPFFEFLGNDIDAGFRLAEKTQDRRLIVSFELAYLLNERTKYSSNLNIITFKRLKGVWNNRLYPIIWYYDKEISENISFEESFRYDELEGNELINEYYKNRSNDRSIVKNEYMFTDVDRSLNKIMYDMNLQSKLDQIKKIIGDSKDTRNYMDDKSLLELHCAVLCYKYFESEKKYKILIAQRAKNRGPNDLQGCWEFGCAKANTYQTLNESIIQEYKRDFGINVQPEIDKDRTDEEPIPLAIYSIKKEDNIHHKGIITFAKILDEDSIVLNFRATKKHDRLDWIEEDNIDEFCSQEQNKVVPDFSSSLKLVFNKLNEMGK